MESIEGRVALVTGGGRGIGRAIALALARAGAHVAVAARTLPELESVAGEVAALGRRTYFFPLDLADRAMIAEAPRLVAAALGPVEILVNNAGMHVVGPLQGLDDAGWDAVLAVNLTGPALLTRACLPGMYDRTWGRVVNVASVAGKTGLKFGAAYAASKHGLVGLTRSLALEGARQGVTVNAICPSWTETKMMDDAVEQVALHTQRTDAEARKALLRGNPIGRAALPEEVADAAVYLASSPVVTGQSLHVDGGEVMA
ncbi:MAG: SDR family oxidoreductase [Anaeromyxobacter sp.]|nr:SDR family oxidoreductase [Anaeromyxobacter sp.]MBL0275678.1 SDR family oxidoreductase [Anaeromyxobacter sp.]